MTKFKTWMLAAVAAAPIIMKLAPALCATAAAAGADLTHDEGAFGRQQGVQVGLQDFTKMPPPALERPPPAVHCETLRRCPDERAALANNSMITWMRASQLVLTRMLRIFQLVCAEARAPFWLADGTLLGAARHRGFIPWDTDADVMIFERDFERVRRVGEEWLRKLGVTIQMSTPVRLRDTSSCYYDYLWRENIVRRGKHGEKTGKPPQIGLQIDVYFMETFNVTSKYLGAPRNDTWVTYWPGTSFPMAWVEDPAAHTRQRGALPARTRTMLFEGFHMPVPRNTEKVLDQAPNVGKAWHKLPPPSKRKSNEGEVDPFRTCANALSNFGWVMQK